MTVRWWVALLAVALLLAACSGNGVRVGEATAVATLSPTATPVPTLVPTVAPEPTAVPSPTPEPTPTTEPTVVVVPPAAAPPPPCEVGPLSADLGFDPFYVQGCSVNGFWVVAGLPVDPAAIVASADVVGAIFQHNPLLADVLSVSGVRLGIIGAEQQLTDMPEYANLYRDFPEVDWNNRARGLGATPEIPLVSVGEENVLCFASDWYLGEDILLHEFAHVIHQQGLNVIDPSFEPRLVAAFNTALESGTWNDTYSTVNHIEYWAEGVQSYFDRNLFRAEPDGIHGPLYGYHELKLADPALFQLVDEVFNGLVLPDSCQVFGP